MMDFLASLGIGAIEKKLDGKPENEVPETAGQKTARFFVSIVWGLTTFIVSLLAFYAMWGQTALSFLGDIFSFEVSSGLGIFAIVISLLFAGITFFVPFLRKKGTFTRSCGIMLLGDALWWIYIWATL